MLRMKLGLGLIVCAAPALGEGKGTLSTKDLCAGISIQEEVWQMDDTSTHVIRRLGPVNIFRFGAGGKRVTNVNKGNEDIECRMGNSSTHDYGDEYGVLNLGMETKISKTGKISMTVSQFRESQRGKREPKDLDKPLRSETFDVSDLKTVQWFSDVQPEKRLMVRYVPLLSISGAPKEAKQHVLGGKEVIIFDDKQTVWGEDITFGAPYVALETPQGTIAMSFDKFSEAQPMGDVKGRRMELRTPDGRLVTLLSASDFLANGERYIVYGRYFPERKSSAPGQLGTSETGDREDFERRLRNVR